ncbi:Sister chromatid cohesion protein [Wickerhamomyces ciferrii]|uniref:Sister chromatid cohesion protein n=1 Tax=Wickerhamomyces ciferrii (strain ATCC 14091 / BCRC 22168 / CBS 111 / JCM 3599 / NBRC 0793 / NRRL Y-1031 F-60-10) TaxID=1206466 RepID=K0KPS9_WICCF|nr:Sister chromatid cohesion protein [Wickerhamomyces ciferrii]CCH43414.1 Sister chromatid cohesion protein [Wickerhamomyces ciferrii]
MELDVLVNLQSDNTYRLVELSPELQSLLEENNESLYIKASTEENDIVLCSETQTFQLKQRNHSNTVLLMKYLGLGDNTLQSYSLQSNVFEIKPIKGTISPINIPIYDGQGNFIKNGNNITVQYLKDNSPISTNEFDKVWFELNGSQLNDRAIILSRDFINKSLHLLIMSIMAANLDINELSLIEVYKTLSEDDDYSIDIVETILRKYSNEDSEPFSLNKIKIAQWYGIESLKKFASNDKLISPSEFLIKWKSEFPPFFDISIDLPLLKGYYVKPLPDRIKYMPWDKLSKDINERLNTLFKNQSTWELDDLIPYIQEFNTKNLKFENFIMKFAKKKKIGKKIIITSR